MTSDFKLIRNRSGRVTSWFSAVGLFAFLLVVLSQSETRAAAMCSKLFDDPGTKVEINTRFGLNEPQLAEMVADGQRAVNFSKGLFVLPSLVSFNAAPKNGDFDFPHYDPASDRILYTYQFGKTMDGKFYSRKDRRVAQNIFFHEFGHLVFRHNVGDNDSLIDFFKDHYVKHVHAGLNPKYVSDDLVQQFIHGYNELFADVFAVTLSQNPRAMSSGEFLIFREKELEGKFHASPKQILRARDFSNKIDVDSWNEGEVHIAFAPARSAFTEHPYALYLFKNEPARLAKVALEAIEFEMKSVFAGRDLLVTLTIPQLNQRMIETMRAFLEKDQRANGSYQRESL